ncbi:aspartyl-phosphate phosphatase Spo0E family protein [Bacillus sp. FJAT-47783]|uniref:aspartyl-phosphate phosphatase Spo0E family protein n=1 Tax=Bacillus sp. FJAT-47783 TaxID=2922712 RepID=UPI001FAC8F6F|nr:aspartyl-phosphate phosphatase Spo0E family protein [Bacillus sp. FJAT-47783]
MANEVLEKLDLEISLKRKKLMEVANLKGFTNSETVMISQELDHLLNEYQKMIAEKTPFQYIYEHVKSWTISEPILVNKSIS